MTKGKVTTLLTSFNRPNMVKEAIQSVYDQTYENWELIILDDGSNKETIDVLASCSDPRVKVVLFHHTPEQQITISTCAVKINMGLKMTDGEFINYLTDDDLYTPGRFKAMVNHFNMYPLQDVVYGMQSMQRSDDMPHRPQGTRFNGQVLEIGAGAIDHNSLMHRASIIEKTGEWPTHDIRCCDASFWEKIRLAGYKFYPIDYITDIHRYHKNELSARMDRGEFTDLSKPCE
jgi:spore maturation protein CgeD